MNRKKIRDLLISLKGDRHWSVVGREMGVNPQNLRGWVRGDSVPTSDNLIAIANYMQVPVGALILQLSDDSDVSMCFDRNITDAQQALASLISLPKTEKAKLAYLLLGQEENALGIFSSKRDQMPIGQWISCWNLLLKRLVQGQQNQLSVTWSVGIMTRTGTRSQSFTRLA